jgi:signal peptidase I
VTTEAPDTADPPAQRGGRHAARRRRPLWQELLTVVVVAVMVAALVKAFLFQAFYIPSDSMEPGLVKDDRILVEKVSYAFGDSPERGDVVVFEDPGDWLPPEEETASSGVAARLMARVGLYPSGGHLVKRVIGVAGDRIHCCDDQGRIEVNGVPLDEEGYAWEDGADCFGPRFECEWKAGPVPDGSIFVLGDNRSHSADSSYHICRDLADGCIPGDEYVRVDLVVGKVFVLLWPFEHFGWLHKPDAFGAVPPGDND